jgi:hypothetical protein
VAREAERSELERLKRGRDDWHPQRALNYAWARIDPIHGRGGSLYIGRPRRPGDPGSGDGWAWERFCDALQNDRAEIDDAVAEYPEQAPRLRQWLQQIEALGQFRNGDPDCSRYTKGEYYEALQLLGYVYTRTTEEEDNG